MAINAYIGLMGSGKSYEVVSSVLVPALASGRDVVSNIEGLQEDKIFEYIELKYPNSKEIGKLILVNDDDVAKDNFFPEEQTTDTNEKIIVDGIVPSGSIVLIDEAWRYWGTDNKIPPNQLQFFTKHRHYTNKIGVACDLVIMVQDMALINRKLKVLVESVYKTQKLKSIGLNTKYRVDIFQGNKLQERARITFYLKQYDKAIFPLYHSYQGGSGKEKQIDKRQNIFTQKGFLIYIGIGLLITIAGFYGSYHMLFDGGLSAMTAKKDVNGEIIKKEENKINAQIGSQPEEKQNNNVSEMRLSGVFNRNNITYYIVLDENNRSRFIMSSNCRESGMFTYCDIDNHKIMYYNKLNNKNEGVL